jgi:hypothetical protein
MNSSTALKNSKIVLKPISSPDDKNPTYERHPGYLNIQSDGMTIHGDNPGNYKTVPTPSFNHEDIEISDKEDIMSHKFTNFGEKMRQRKNENNVHVSVKKAKATLSRGMCG